MSLRIFITGGAGGLGREIARIYASRGARVLIGDINFDAAQATASEIGATAIACDVTQEDDLVAVAAWLHDNWGGLDYLVNNAGVAQMGPIAATTIDDWNWALDINLLGGVRAIRACLPVMGEGARIVNIASMAAMLYLPNAAVYNASKAAVLALSETLMLELRPRGITVQVACPAFFRTDLARNMRAADDTAAKMTARLVDRARLGAPDIARAVVQGIDRGDSHILTHPDSARMWRLKRYLPFGSYMGLMRKQLAKLDARMARPARKDSGGA